MTEQHGGGEYGGHTCAPSRSLLRLFVDTHLLRIVSIWALMDRRSRAASARIILRLSFEIRMENGCVSGVSGDLILGIPSLHRNYFRFSIAQNSFLQIHHMLYSFLYLKYISISTRRGIRMTDRIQERRRAAVRKYTLAHPERVRARKAAYRARNRKKIAAYNAAYHRAYYPANIEKVRARARAWNMEHPEQAKARVVAWGKANPLKLTILSERKRARKAQAPINDFTTTQWKTMLEHYGHRCVYCGTKKASLTQDHIQPLSKGGSHTLNNIVPACKSCNSRKHAGPVLVPVQPMLLA